MTTASAVKERPIIFSGPMVRAILEGRKTQTRRVIKNVPPGDTPVTEMYFSGRVSPYGVVGDRLWVRESWSLEACGDPYYEITYRADRAHREVRAETDEQNDLLTKLYDTQRGEWRPSIHMPRWASRILLEVVSVRVERLQDVTEEDAKAEGVEQFLGSNYWKGEPHPVKGHPKSRLCARDAFADLWNGINAARDYGWDVNPWVWVVEFRRIEPDNLA